MATVKERWRGVVGSQDERRIDYIVTGATDDNDALDQLETDAPALYDNMPRENISIREISKKDGIYEGSAIYTRNRGSAPTQIAGTKPTTQLAASEEPNKWLYSFDTGLQSVHVAESRFGTTRFTPALTVPEIPFKGINATGRDLHYEGGEIRKPLSTFTLEYFPSDVDVTASYQKAVRDAVGKVNSAEFMKHAIGEVLFTGATGTSRNTNDWQFTFRFEVSPNISNQVIGDPPDDITYSAWGHDLVWVFFQEKVATVTGTGAGAETQKVTVQVPRQVNVEHVYDTVDFNTVLFV